jgi:KipI family sensor histidine kinase inhibitor
VRVRQVGAAAVLLELADLDETRAWYAELLRRRDAGELAALDLVPAARTVLVDGVDPDAASRLLRSWPAPAPAAHAGGDPVTVPVRMDGPDLDEVARRWGVGPDQVGAELASWPLVVGFCGFVPGFAYLVGVPTSRQVPRRRSPRPRVPAGSVGLAGPYCGVYPRESPGGWALVGSTDLELVDLGRDPPGLLAPGTRVRFTMDRP